MRQVKSALKTDETKTTAYVDWETPMLREPSDFRYRSMAGIASAEEYAAALMKPEDCEEFRKARDKAVKRVFDKMAADNIKSIELAEKIGCSKSLISKMKNGNRTFSMPVETWEALSYDVMDISVHDLILGENRPLVLPKKYSIPAAIIQKKVKITAQKKLAQISKNSVLEYYTETQAQAVGGHHRDISELMRERITDIKEDYGFYNYQIFGSKYDGMETPKSLKSGLAMFWSTSVVPKHSFLCYASLYYKNQNLDYLVSEDPMRGHFDTYAKAENGEKVLLTGYCKEFWRNLLIVDPERKAKLLELAWANIFLHYQQVIR